MIALSGGIVRLLALARRLLVILLWLGVAGLVAATVAFAQLATADEPLRAVVLAVVCFAPPLVVLHFVLLVRLAGLRFGAVSPVGWVRGVLALRALSMAPLLQPPYWLLLVLGILGCVGLVPLALGLALF
jgi:hypothetical protein